MRHLLDVDDLSSDELTRLLDLAELPDPTGLLDGKGIALLFEKPSLRTRHSAEMAVVQLGGHPITVRADEVGVGERETAVDIVRVLAGYHTMLGARVFDHDQLRMMASPNVIPVINLLSDEAHPCQTLADLLTMRQELGGLAGRTVCWVGDFNNVARSLTLGAALSGMAIRVASPSGFGPTDTDFERLAQAGAIDVLVTTQPQEAVKGADAVHTDVWTSMGLEKERQYRTRAFEGFTVDDQLLSRAEPEAIFMHCLPAHRGEEVTAAVIDGPRSRVIAQAHNRLHSFRGLLLWLTEVNQ